MDQAVAAASELGVVPPDSFLEPYLDRMLPVGIKTISDLERYLKEQEQMITAFGKCCYRSPALRS